MVEGMDAGCQENVRFCRFVKIRHPPEVEQDSGSAAVFLKHFPETNIIVESIGPERNGVSVCHEKSFTRLNENRLSFQTCLYCIPTGAVHIKQQDRFPGRIPWCSGI